MVGGQVDDDGIGVAVLDAGDAGGRLAVGQREHVGADALIGQRVVTDVGIAQFTAEFGDLVGDPLPGQFARGDETELERRVPGQQPDQFGADVAACADDADGGGRRMHRIQVISKS
jgi:hypothetical protein